MATYSIITGSGFTGNAQYVTGSMYEGIGLGSLVSGSKYHLTFQYTSNVPLNVYSSDYSDKFIVTQYPSTIAINTGSIKSWSGEFLAVYDKENFLGLGSDGWFAVDKLRVKPIPNLAIATFANNGTYPYDTFSGASATGFTAVESTTLGRAIASSTFNFISGKRYRFSYKIIINSTSFGVSLNIGVSDIGSQTVKFHNTAGTFTGSYDITANSNHTHYGFRVEAGDSADFVVSGFHFYEIPEWTASGNHTSYISTLDKSGTGTQSLKVTASGAGNTSNCVTLPSANIESCVATKKYTLQGEARLDASSLSYGSDIITNGDNEAALMSPILISINGATVLSSDFASYTAKFLQSADGNGSINFKAPAGLIEISYYVYIPSGSYSWIGVLDNTDGSYYGTQVTTQDTWVFVKDYRYKSISWTLGIGNHTAVTGNSFYIDNLSIKQANPLTITTQLGTKSVTSSTLSIVAGTFTKFVLNFEATASEVNQDLKLWLSGAGSVYVDKLSLTQAYDATFRYKLKNTGAMNGSEIYYLGHSKATFGDPALGFEYWLRTSVGGIQAKTGDGTIGFTLTYPTNVISALTDSTIDSVDFVYNRTSATESYIIFNGTSSTGGNFTLVGKIILPTALTIGGYGSTASFKGMLSYLQIIRFENISQSTFNSAITGLQYPTGGGAEEVLRLTWNSIAGTTAYNESTYGTLASTNAVGFGTKNAATNIVTVKDYLYQKDKLIQPTEVNRPVYTSGSYFQFDGSNDFLYHTGSFGIVKEFYIKFKPDVVNTNMGLVNFNATSSLFISSSNIAFMSGSTFSTMSIYNSSLIPTSSVTNSNWNILHCSDNTGTLANLFKIGVAGTTYYDGAVQRYLSYDRQLSDNDRIRILRNLSF